MYAFTAALLAQYADSPGRPLKAARLETASRCPLPPREHARQDGLDRIDDAQDVDPDGLLDVRVLSGSSRVGAPNPALATSTSAGPEPALDLGDGRPQGSAVADVGDRGHGRAAGRGDRRGRGLELVGARAIRPTR